MLLGPWTSIEFRRKVKRQLRKRGYNVIIMEDDKTIRENMLDIKFDIITKRYEPLFIAFFLKGRMDGVIFEIGYLCGKYGIESISDELLFISTMGYDWSKTTSYIDVLIPRVTKDEFDESKSYRKASERIHNFATGYMRKMELKNH